ncbi:hypothetical protein ACPOL_4156 [Acidisarcina polymorpha]|uniref:Uncharacterized protein n=1 Tax=Acidisarcina polymorpha TaxID=2211140 RepID=A0A2Z5G2K2_9BACT|nr:hypothetical protein ACPOL_4156 [Acidisarcina polymorpha]
MDRVRDEVGQADFAAVIHIYGFPQTLIPEMARAVIFANSDQFL